MSNRRKRVNASLGVVSEGLKIPAGHKANARIPTPPPGEHLWTVVGMWRIANPGAARVELDLENLVTLEGPGCFVCERPYGEAVLLPCPGEPPPGGGWAARGSP